MDRLAFFNFAESQLPRETVDVPGFGPVTVRGITGAEYARYEEASTVPGEKGEPPTFRADRGTLVRLAVIDPQTGAHVFTDADVPRLRDLPYAVLAPICHAAGRLYAPAGKPGN